MVIFTTRQERELLERLRRLGGPDEANALSAEVLALKRQISDLEVAKSKLDEQHERERRELKHMIGLEKKRQEVEIEQAKREVSITVREENLKQDKQRFEEQLAFNTKRFESLETYLKEMVQTLMKRLPEVKVKGSL